MDESYHRSKDLFYPAHQDPKPAYVMKFQLNRLKEVGSTNDVALEAARSGAEDGLVVWAQRQVRGRGQRERIWQSQPKSSLTFSVLCRPTEDEQPLLGRLPRLEPWQWRGR